MRSDLGASSQRRSLKRIRPPQLAAHFMYGVAFAPKAAPRHSESFRERRSSIPDAPTSSNFPLCQQMEKANYDLLVMGGYSHPKWLEFIFGGATKSILLSSKIPVLVSR